MSRIRPGRPREEPIEPAQKILSLSDDDFAKWLDRVIDAGLG